MSRAIELLEQIDSVLKISTYRKVSKDELIRMVFQADILNKQALAELKKQPLAGDFTSRIRNKLLDVALYCGGVNEMAEPFQDLREACVIIDQQAEDNKDLHREYQDLAAINLKQAEEIERLKKRIEELEVETSI